MNKLIFTVMEKEPKNRKFVPTDYYYNIVIPVFLETLFTTESKLKLKEILTYC